MRDPLLGAIAVHNLHPVAGFPQAAADFFGDHHGAMLASSAAETDGEITFAFLDVVRQQINQKIGDALDEFARLRKRTNVFGHTRIASGEGAKFRHEMRIRQKTHVEEQVRIFGNALTEAEADAGHQNVFSEDCSRKRSVMWERNS